MDISWEEDLFHINLHANYGDESASVEDIDEVEEMLNDICMGRFSDGNTGDSSTTPSPTINGYKLKNFDQLLKDA